MYRLRSQEVKAAAEEIDFSAMDRSKRSNFKRSFHTRGNLEGLCFYVHVLCLPLNTANFLKT